MIPDLYAAAVRDEVWAGGVLVESRVSHGEARVDGTQITATDQLSDASLRDACDAEMARVRSIASEIGDARVRIVVKATSDEGLSSTMTITAGGISIVTTPQHAIADVTQMRGWRSEPAEPHLPLVWHNGSAAVLLHEAVGHAAEHGHPKIEWPSWLRVRDGESDLLAGVAPHAMRRASFRDVPMPRMKRVVVEQEGARFKLPDRHVNIHYIHGGSYEPLTESVTLEVAVPRITIRATRAQIARSLIGAHGEPIRYPGVICSREGQELFVESWAPVIVTTELS